MDLTLRSFRKMQIFKVTFRTADSLVAFWREEFPEPVPGFRFIIYAAFFKCRLLFDSDFFYIEKYRFRQVLLQ